MPRFNFFAISREACNYNPLATEASTCFFLLQGYDCDGNCVLDIDNDGICNSLEILGCQDLAACNYNAQATDAGSCIYAQPHYDCLGQCISL